MITGIAGTGLLGSLLLLLLPGTRKAFEPQEDSRLPTRWTWVSWPRVCTGKRLDGDRELHRPGPDRRRCQRLNGAMLSRRPDHYKNGTIARGHADGSADGPGRRMTRDVLVNQIPSALTNPVYITVCVIAGFVGYRITFAKVPAVP